MSFSKWKVKEFLMADINEFKKSFSEFISTFKETSFDNENNISLCTDESQENINFDKIIETRYIDSNKRPKSFDSIYIDNMNIYCVEFKNQTTIDNNEVAGKLIAGKRELDSLLSELNIQKKDYKFIYCVVHKSWNPPYMRFKQGILKGVPRFNLLQYKNAGIIDDIVTEDVNFFKKEFERRFHTSLSC